MRRFYRSRDVGSLTAYATGIDDILAELSSVSTGGKATPVGAAKTHRIRKVIRTKTGNTTSPQSTGSERLNTSLREMKSLEDRLGELEKERMGLVAKVATDGEVEREGVAFPSASVPMSSQETRLDGGEQEFRSDASVVPTVIPMSASVGHASVVGVLETPPALYEDANGSFVEFKVGYVIPFESPVTVSVDVRAYGDVFTNYCEELKMGDTLHISGWLMPGPEKEAVVVCLPRGGNITVVKRS